MSCLAIKPLGKEEEGGHSELQHLSSRVIDTHDEALLSWKCLNTCLLMVNELLILLVLLILLHIYLLNVHKC